MICKFKYTTVTVICCLLSASGDVEDCLVQPLPQGQFTPLPEALCWVILDLTSSGQAAVLERIRAALHVAFPDIQRPSQEMVYDALAKLMAERKVCRTLRFVSSYVTPCSLRNTDLSANMPPPSSGWTGRVPPKRKVDTVVLKWVEIPNIEVHELRGSPLCTCLQHPV